MKIPPTQAELRSRPLLILLDYDGTLTDFKRDPERSNLPPKVRSLLARVQKRHPVIMVTGRYVDSLRRVSGLKGVPVVGTHGFEADRLPRGLQFTSPGQRARFRKEAALLWKALQGLPDRYPGIHIEKKPYSSTLHFRGAPLSPSRVRGLIQEYKVLFRRTVTARLWALHGGKMMIEAMPRGFSKGRSVRKLLAEFPGRFPLYAGDDLGDISLMKVLGNKGLRIAVGSRIPDRYCDLRFAKPKDFIRWLGKLA